MVKQLVMDSSSHEENETGYRGFRKRWRDGASVASVANSESGMSIVEGADAISLDLDLDAGGSQFGSNLGGEDYEPSIRPESVPVTGSVQVVASGSSEFGWRCEALRSAVDRTRLYGDTFAWERPDFGGVFQKPDLFSGTIVSGYKHSLAPTSIGLIDVLDSELISSRVGDPSLASGGLPPVEKLTLRGARKEAADEDIRRLAMSKLKDLILGDSSASGLGISLQGMLTAGAHDTLILQSLMDCFRAKASTTLQKRANSLWRLSKELKKIGQLHPLRMTEEQLYTVLCNLRECKSGATSGQHMLEALAFFDSTAGFALIDLRATVSGRCKGVARDMYLGKDPLRQKHPLQVLHVKWLEELMLSTDSMEACIIGQLLFCIHGVCRWRDSQRLKRIFLETSHGESLLQADALSSKTSLTMDAKTRFTPYAALGLGVRALGDWADRWIKSREDQGLLIDEFFLPSFSQKLGSWIDQPMSASEATCWLREFLGRKFPLMNLSDYGSHSCKATVLTWAGRSTSVTFSMPERRLMGHHVDPSARSVLTYSREAYTSLYGKILLMYFQIRTGDFNPDLSAVERVVQRASMTSGEGDLVPSDGGAVGQSTPSADDPHVISDSDSDSSEASDVEQALDMVGDTDECCIETLPDFPGVPTDGLRVHCSSGLVHVVNEDDYLLCGRSMSRNFVLLSDVSVPDHVDSCQHCLRIFKRSMET